MAPPRHSRADAGKIARPVHRSGLPIDLACPSIGHFLELRAVKSWSPTLILPFLSLLIGPAAATPSATVTARVGSDLFSLQGTTYLLIGATCMGALIALGAVVVAQRLRNARDMAALRHSLATSADWWWRTDAQLTVQEVQPSRRPITWFDAQSLVGRKPWQITSDQGTPPTLMQAVAARAPFFDVLIHLTVGDAARLLTLSGAPLFSATGHFMGYAGTCRDLTSLVHALAPTPTSAATTPTSAAATPHSSTESPELARLRASFAERSRAYELAIKDLDSFAHSVSHDLRAPLRVVDGFAHIVLEDYAQTGRALDDLGRDHLKRIVSAGHRMNAMIETLLAMARMTSKELARTEVNLSALAHEIAEELQAQHTMQETTHAPVEFVITEGLVVDGDPSLLGGVMQNLLGNAWKFSSRAAAPRIELGVRRQGDHNEYFVRDNGAGFDMRFADKLFGLFQRFHSAHEYPGTGVGLATVQRIVRKHGGRIWAESEPGKGATFYFTLWEQRGNQAL